MPIAGKGALRESVGCIRSFLEERNRLVDTGKTDGTLEFQNSLMGSAGVAELPKVGENLLCGDGLWVNFDFVLHRFCDGFFLHERRLHLRNAECL